MEKFPKICYLNYVRRRVNILHVLQDYAISDSRTIEPRDRNLAFLADSAKTLTYYDIMDILDNYKCSGTYINTS